MDYEPPIPQPEIAAALIWLQALEAEYPTLAATHRALCAPPNSLILPEFTPNPPKS